MDGHAIAPAALFSGPIGVGKTTMAECLARDYGMEPVTIYGTDCRGKEIPKIMAALKTMGFDGKKKLPIIKNAEFADEDFVVDLLDLMIPKIFVVNRSNELHWKINSACQHVVFQMPTREDLIEYLRRQGKEFPGELIISRMKTFADAKNWSLGGSPRSFQVLSELEEARAIFGGEEVSEYQINFQRLMEYYLYNGGNPALASHLDLIAHDGRTREGLIILRSQTLTGIINMPYEHWKKRGKRGVYIRVLGFVD